MSLRAGKSYVVPGRGGTVNTKRRTYTGPGKAPGGTRKVKAAPPKAVTSHEGRVISTSGFSSPPEARQAAGQARAASRRVRRIERQQASALGFHRRTQALASQPSPPRSQKVSLPTQPPPKPPSFKPIKFQGVKTAGAPTLGSLRQASKTGTLKLNQQGYATTPQVRKVSGTLKRLESKARGGSNGPLPGLTPAASHNARVVLRQGTKAGATRKDKLAAAETGLVESHFENLPGGTSDSQGWRQERASIYPNPRNVKAGAQRFFSEAKEQSGATAGELAANVQRPAEQYRGRYDEERPKANAIVKAFERGGLKPAQQRKLAVTKRKALNLGLAAGKQANVGQAPPRVVKKFKAAVSAMKQIDAKHFEYQWGGGHTGVAGKPVGGPGPGFDCSGAVSAMLHSVGALDTPLTSGNMGQALKPGPGAITVFYNSVHTFAYIPALKKYWGTSTSNAGGGAGFFPKSVGDAEVASGNSAGSYAVGHVPGLGKKQAAQMGVNNLGPGSQPFPGMTISPSGTAATINPSSGMTQEKAGFSKSPIKLTSNQKAHRTLKKLAQLGAGINVDKQAVTEDKGAILKSLERTYGSRAV